MAFDRVVDRLLDSPAYGQRWARHWLDVARYADYYDADPKTRTASCELTEAWRYRDWVVDAFNRDLPFDQFITHQIAGDLLPNPSGDEVYPAGLIASTFLSNGVWDRGDADKEKIVSDMVDDQIDIVGKAFLGLTLGWRGVTTTSLTRCLSMTITHSPAFSTARISSGTWAQKGPSTS